MVFTCNITPIRRQKDMLALQFQVVLHQNMIYNSSPQKEVIHDSKHQGRLSVKNAIKQSTPIMQQHTDYNPKIMHNCFNSIHIFAIAHMDTHARKNNNEQQNINAYTHTIHIFYIRGLYSYRGYNSWSLKTEGIGCIREELGLSVKSVRVLRPASAVVLCTPGG